MRQAAIAIVLTALVGAPLIAPTAAQAELSETDKAALAERQAELLREVLARPDDLDLLFEYARVSVALEDFESAISTLERALIVAPDAWRIRVELGALYFKLGSYTIAERYFRNALEDGAPDAEEAALIQRYLDSIAERGQTHRLDGEITAGAVFSTNATLGGDSAGLDLGDVFAEIPAENRQTEDFGARVTAQLSHRYDLGRANDDHWRTDASYYGVHYFEARSGDVDAGLIRTGPQLSLDDNQYGPKLRPFLEGDLVGLDQEFFYATGGVGLRLSEAFDDQWFGAIEGGVLWRSYAEEFDDRDGLVGRLFGEVAYTPTRDLVIRGSALLEREEAQVAAFASTEGSVRLSASYSYDSGFDLEAPWELSGYAQTGARYYDAPDPDTAPGTTRRDWELQVGVAHSFAIDESWAVVVDADVLLLRSNVSDFNVDALRTGVSLSYRF